MPRVAFQLRIRAGQEQAYEDAHRRVWPELLAELSEAGVREYSIFRRGQELFLYLHVADVEHWLRTMAASAVDRRWQETMAALLEPVQSLENGERLAMMQEVFYMPGASLLPGDRDRQQTSEHGGAREA